MSKGSWKRPSDNEKFDKGHAHAFPNHRPWYIRRDEALARLAQTKKEKKP